MLIHCSGRENGFKTSKVIEVLFAVLAKEKIRKSKSAVEETIPPYPIIPHFFVLQRNEAESSIRFLLIKFLNLRTYRAILEI